MFLALVAMMMMFVSETTAAPAPAPVTVEALLLAKIIGLAGLKGNMIFIFHACKFKTLFINFVGYLLGRDLNSK